MSGCVLGPNAIRVSQSKTAIVPVNNQYLPRSLEERERVARTVYVANLDRGLEREVIRDFFESMCGEARGARGEWGGGPEGEARQGARAAAACRDVRAQRAGELGRSAHEARDSLPSCPPARRPD